MGAAVGASAEILLDRVRSLYNVGAFFRTADAVGAERIYLGGYTGSPDQPGAAKTALGAERSVPWDRTEDPLELIERWRKEGRQVAAIETSDDAVDLFEWTPRFPVGLIFGNEVDGVAPELRAQADIRVSIPMVGVKDSLNVAVAGGVVLYELLRKRRNGC